MIHELYPGRWRHLLLRLCGPGCGCPSPGKNPHVEGAAWQRHALERFEDYGEKAAAERLRIIEAHFARGGNVGLAVPSFCAALDVDTDLEGNSPPEGPLARDAILALCDDHPVQKTGNPIGIHVWGRLTERRVCGSHFAQVPITVRHVGNQVVVAPSIHRNGRSYEWLSELPDDPLELPEFDLAMFRHVAKNRTPIQRARDEGEGAWRQRVSQAWLAELEDPEVVFPVSRRHDALLWLSWHLAVCGAKANEIALALHDLATTRCAGEGRFSSRAGSPERRQLACEIDACVRSARRHKEMWADGR